MTKVLMCAVAIFGAEAAFFYLGGIALDDARYIALAAGMMFLAFDN